MKLKIDYSDFYYPFKLNPNVNFKRKEMPKRVIYKKYFNILRNEPLPKKKTSKNFGFYINKLYKFL